MKKVIFLFLVSLLIGCGVNDTNHFEEGNYSGTFLIVEPDGHTLTGNVDFTFSNNRYSNYCLLWSLPSGSGEYSIKRNIIKITDTALHPAVGDGTRILSGDFEFSFNGKVLSLKQNDTKYNRKRTITLTKQN